MIGYVVTGGKIARQALWEERHIGQCNQIGKRTTGPLGLGAGGIQVLKSINQGPGREGRRCMGCASLP